MNKILMLTPFYPPNIGGAETFAEELVKEAGKCHEVYVLTYMPFQGKAESYQMMKLEKGSTTVRRLKWFINNGKSWKGLKLRNLLSVFPKMAFYSFFLMLRTNFKTVHSLGLLSGLTGAFIKRAFKIEHIITLLALYDFKNWTGIRKNVAKFIFNNADVIFVEGDNGMNDLLGLRPIKTRIEKFNHWVDQDIFKPDESKDTRGKKFILFVGRPIKEKGIEVVRGAERILKDNNKYEFIYIENTPHKDLPKYYQMADIVVIPSLYPEGFSRVVAEAASCGCAVITSDRGSLPEMVREFGMSIEMTPENLAEEIRDVCQEDKFSRLYSMRYSSYDYAVDNFSTKNAEGFLNAYKQ